MILINNIRVRQKKLLWLYTLFIRSRGNFVIIKDTFETIEGHHLSFSKMLSVSILTVDSPPGRAIGHRDGRRGNTTRCQDEYRRRSGTGESSRLALFLLIVITFAEYRCEMPAGPAT